MRVATAALCAVALVTAGCGERERRDAAPAPDASRAPDAARTPAAPSATARPTPSPEALIRALLRRRASALQAGRSRALAATAGSAGQRVRDRRAALRARPLPLRGVRYEIVAADIGAFTAALRVRSTYRLRGVRGRQGAERVLRLRKTGRGWRVTREQLRGERHPWELAAFRAHATERFLVLAPPGIDGAAVGAVLEEARQAAAARLPAARLRRRLPVVIAADPIQARRLTARIRGVERLAAITDAEVRTRGPARQVVSVVSIRLLIPWPRFASLDAAGRERVVAHELTHAALVRETSGRTPAWLQEGVALYASRDRRVLQAAGALRAAAIPATPAARASRRALSLRTLSAPDAIARLDGAALGDAYAYASAAAYYLVERHGERGMRRLYRAFNDPAIPGGAGRQVTDAAMRSRLGVSLRGFERALRTWILRTGS